MASSPIFYRLLQLGSIFILYCNSYYCNAFIPPPTSSKLLQKQQFDTPSPILSKTSTLQALPIDELLTSSTTSVVSSALPSNLSSLLLQSSTLLSSTTATDTTELVSNNILSTLLRTPTLWSVLAMTSIVALLVAWEEAIENIRHNTPKPIMPVIDSMLAEVGGLGFIGLFLSTIVTGGPLGQIISSLSSNYLNDDELLLETFEFLHTFFFQVGILFFAIAGIVVGAILKDVQSLSTISELALDTDGDGEVSLDELADALQVDSMIVDLDGDGIITPEELTEAIRSKSTNINSFTSTFINEWNKNDIDYASENLVVRQRMMDKFQLPSTFKIEDYFAQIFGHNLEEVVELSPVTWLPLIPLIAVDNSVDLSRDVVSAASSNAFDSAGYFYATPWVLYSTILLQIISLVWSTFNYWKLSAIKEMLLPTLVKEHEGSEAILLPPRYEDKVLLERFNSSPSFFAWGEQFFTGGGSKVNPPNNGHEKLYGAMGSKLPSIMRDSIQFHTWLSVALIVYSTTQIIFRDATALYLHANVGDPDTVVQELVLWSVFVASSIFQLSLAPTTFLNYCFVTSIEEFVKEDVVKKSIVFEDMDLDKLWKRSVSTPTIDEEKIEEVLVEEVFELTEGEKTTLLNRDDVTAKEEDLDGSIEVEEEIVAKDEVDTAVEESIEVEEDIVIIEDTDKAIVEEEDTTEEVDAAEENVSTDDSKRSKIEEDPREDLELKEDLSPPQTKGSSARYLENLSQDTNATSSPQTKRGSNLRSLVKDMKPTRKGGPRNNYLDSL